MDCSKCPFVLMRHLTHLYCESSCHPQLFYWLFLGVRINQDDRNWLAKQSQDMLRKYPPTKRPFLMEKIKSVRWILSNLLSKTAIQLDYDFLPPKVFVKFLRAILEKRQTVGLDGVTIPIVASGHTKNMHSPENIARILQAVQTTLPGRVVYWTLREAIQSWTDILQRTRHCQTIRTLNHPFTRPLQLGEKPSQNHKLG